MGLGKSSPLPRLRRYLPRSAGEGVQLPGLAVENLSRFSGRGGGEADGGGCS